MRPKIHFSSPRTEWLIEEGAGGEEPKVRQTRWAYHADYVNPFEFIDFMQTAAGLPAFDVMLEVRAKDLALTQLRDDLRRFAPDLCVALAPDLEASAGFSGKQVRPAKASTPEYNLDRYGRSTSPPTFQPRQPRPGERNDVGRHCAEP